MKKSVKVLVLLMLVLVLWKLLMSCGQTDLTGADTTSPMIQEVTFDKPEDILLVNPWNPIPEDYTVDTRELSNQHRVALGCYEPLLDMLAACEAAGFRAEVISGFRTIKDQENLFENKLQRVLAEGYAPEDAHFVAALEVAVPGTSEHHTGYAVDIVDADYGYLDASQAQRPAQQWLMAHCAEYGFILRYPPEKTEETGIIYEPWHYRYVGVKLAKEITESGLCLEEYLELGK